MHMTPEAFHTWSQRLRLSAETEALITTIRASPPVRRPSGRAGNITRRYVLKDWLVNAVTATLAQGGTSLTEEMLTRTMPHPAKRVSLEMEARAGEHQVALHNSESAKQFQALLKQPAKATNGKAEPTSGSVAAPPPSVLHKPEATLGTSHVPMPQIALHPPYPRVGQRAPRRDPVGDLKPEEPSARCSFVGPLDLAPVRLVETGVTKVECPTCGALRTLHPQGGTLLFPSHPKRLRRPPSVEVRWITQGSGWDLSRKPG